MNAEQRVFTEEQKRRIVSGIADAVAWGSIFRIDDKHIKNVLWEYLSEAIRADENFDSLFETKTELSAVTDGIVAKMKRNAKWFFVEDAAIDYYVNEGIDNALYEIEQEGE